MDAKWQRNAAKDGWIKVVAEGGADGPVLAHVADAELLAYEKSQRVGGEDYLRGVGGNARLDAAYAAQQAAKTPVA